MLVSTFKFILETILRILWTIYLAYFLGIKVSGICDVRAFSIEGGRIRRQVTGGRSCRIDKHVKIRARLTLEDDVYIGEGCRIFGSGVGSSVFIGRGTSLNGGTLIFGNVRIGRYCVMGDAYLLALDHVKSYAAWQRSFILKHLGVGLPLVDKGGIEIGNDVGISYRAVVLPGVYIGDGAGIPAGSVVNKNVPPYSIAAGAPARLVKYRFSPETIEKLLRLKWWDWPLDKIKRNKEFFTTDLNTVEDIDTLIVD